MILSGLEISSKIGQSYSQDGFDPDRPEELSGIADSMHSKISDEPIEKIKDFFFPDSGYATVKGDLRAGIF
jgi:hypothetical protein